MGIRGPSKNTKTSNGRSSSTCLVLFVSRPSISTTYDQRKHPQGPKTSIITPNTFITFRICCKRLFGVPQKILKHLKESVHPQSLFGLWPGIVFHPYMTTGATHRNLRQAHLHPNTIITFRFCCKWVYGVLPKIVKYLIWGLRWNKLFYLCPSI